MIYYFVRKGINRDDIPDLAKKIEEKHHSSHSISFKIDTTSNRDSANSMKPPLVLECNQDLRTLLNSFRLFNLDAKELTECPPCDAGQQLLIDEHETSTSDCGGNKIPTLESETGDTIDKSKVDVRSNAHGMDLQQPSYERIYDTKIEYKNWNDKNNDCVPNFHPDQLRKHAHYERREDCLCELV